MIQRTFTPDDQITFALLSGDYNPLHLDAIEARRLLFGSPVVHGIYLLLWALDHLLEKENQQIKVHFLNTVFPKAVRVGQKVELSLVNVKDRHYTIELICDKIIVTTIEVILLESNHQKVNEIKDESPPKKDPLILSEDDIRNNSGYLNLYCNSKVAKELFPNLIRCIAPVQIATLLGTTRLVGNFCPGLNSVFSEISLKEVLPNELTQLNYDVCKLDPRFGLVFMNINSPGMIGKVKSFIRPPAKKQDSFIAMRQEVNKNEFLHQRALIIGGSRGLGEVTAKLLAAGGAEVKLTFVRGEKDATTVVDDIVKSGGKAETFSFDILNPDILSDTLSTKNWQPTHLYYFATPFIFSGERDVFSTKIFSDFCDYYIKGFMNTLNALSSYQIKNIFYPSSVAINEIPINMGEYTSAKMASEMLCQYLEKNDELLTIYTPRLPRMATDQTSTIIPVNNHEPVSIMLQELRLFSDKLGNNNE